MSSIYTQSKFQKFNSNHTLSEYQLDNLYKAVEDRFAEYICIYPSASELNLRETREI